MSGYQVGPETWVSVHTQVFDEEGESASAAETIGFVFGLGSLFPKVERALEMHEVGDVVTIALGPKEAFGHRDPARILEVSKEDFPSDVQPGDRFEVENEDGGILVLSVLEVGEDFVVVDSNHPLCDQTVKLVVTVLEVRPASEEELATAISEAEEAAQSQAGPDETLSAPLVPLERLLRGRPKG